MNFCSGFYKDRAFFGGYPNHLQFNELIDNGITVFIDLTTMIERMKLPFDYSRSLKAQFTYFNYPILDNHIPKNLYMFSRFLFTIRNILQDTNRKVYIHCKGGHGRSGVVVACLLVLLQFPSPYHSLRMTTLFHEKRPNLKQKWKGVPCPQKFHQRQFVINFFHKRLMES